MKNKPGFIWLAAIAAAFMFTMAACPNGNNDNPQPFDNDITAAELVSKMRVGWNLGNTFDAGTRGLPSDPTVATVEQLETNWLNPKIPTTKENITTLKDAGFNVIRIPVSWAKVADKENYNIRKDWMARVTEVVDYAIDNEMYVILNTHHDSSIFKFMDSTTAESEKAFKKIWGQIAGNFKDYNEKLIFEALNEPSTPGSPAQWNGGTDEEHENLNRHYQIFVDTVRKSGSNNKKRFLMVNTYAASAESRAMDGLEIPKDTAKNKIIVSCHFYQPENFALYPTHPQNTWSKDNTGDTFPIKQRVDRADRVFASNGIPVILGEMGAVNKNNTAARAEWAEFYTSYAREKGMPCIWWDNGAVFTGANDLFGIFDRENNTFPFPEIIEALMKGSQ